VTGRVEVRDQRTPEEREEAQRMRERGTARWRTAHGLPPTPVTLRPRTEEKN